MAVKVAKQESHIEGLNALLSDYKRDVQWARDELGYERNRRIRAENDLNATVKSSMKKDIANALEQACLRLRWREREREK